MNDYLLSALLGVVEGLTEFLPVSSTAHLRIAEALLGVSLGDGYWKMFTIVIQLGAIACLPLYFRERIRRITRGPALATALAFVITSALSLAFIRIIGRHLESLTVMGWSLVVGGGVMWLVDDRYRRGRLRRRTDNMDQIGLVQAAWVGLGQTVSAIFPGTSRSMATISSGQLVGMSREAALEFSFFLSMPTMLAATLYDLFKTVRHGADSPLGVVHMTAHGWLVLGLGFVVSFAVAYAVVAWFMHWVRHRGFVPFAVYRLAAGAAVLIWMTRGGS